MMVRRRQEQTQKPSQVNKRTFFVEDSPQKNTREPISVSIPSKKISNQGKSASPLKASPRKKQLKKRKLFANEDCVEEIAPKRAKTSAEQPGFACRLFGNPHFWRYVQIKGSYPILRYTAPQVVKNRPLYHLIRDISEILYRNIEDYQKSELCEIRKKHPSLDCERAIELLRIMCKKTMKYESEGLSVVFEVDPLIVAAREAFSTDAVQVPFDSLSVPLQQLRLICQVRKVTVSEEELIQMRNRLAQFLSHVQTDFILTILKINQGWSIQYLQKFILLSPIGYKVRSDIGILSEFSFVTHFHSSIMKRCAETSLWVLIPCESKSSLLDHVVPYALANCLPTNVREFLTDWMVKVQRRMRKRLTNGDLRRVADSLIAGKQRHLACNSPLIGELLHNIYENVLNCQDYFKVFRIEWLNELLKKLESTYRELRVKYSLSEKILENSQFEHLSSLFPDTESSEHLLRHLKANLYHFFIRFCYHTLRFVFEIDNYERKLRYDGELELEEVPDFQEIDRVEEELERPHKSPPPVEVAQVQPQMVFQPPQQNSNQLPSMAVPHSMFPVYQPPIQEFKYIPPSSVIRQVPKSVPVNPIRTPKIEPVEPNLSPEVIVIGEKLKNGRALRKPLEVSGGHLNQMNENESVPRNYPVSRPSVEEFNYVPINPNPFLQAAETDHVNRLRTPKIEPVEPNLSPEVIVIGEKLKNGRDLRTPSEVSGGHLNQENEDEGVRKKWKDTYRLLMEWKGDLRDELKNVKERCEKLERILNLILNC